MKMLRRLLAPLLALCFALTSAPVGALPPARTAAILSGVQGWSFPGSSADLYFARNGGSCTINRLLKPCASLLTTTRASTGYAQWADGHLSLFAANIPRITDLGLLVEQAATNLALQSQFASSWGLTSVTLTNNAAQSRLGNVSATSLNEDGTTGAHFTSQAITKAASALSYTFSADIYPNNRTYVWVGFDDGTASNRSYVQFNLAGVGSITGAASSVGGFSGASASITKHGSAYNITLTTTTNTGTTVRVIIASDNNSGFASTAPSFAGANNSALYIDLAQLELGSVATSYIPTTTVAVTRAADAVTLTNGSLPDTISIFASAVLGNITSTSGLVGWGTTNPNRATLASSSASPLFNNDSAGFNIVPSGAFVVGSVGKIAARNQSGSFAVTFNGGTTTTSALTGGPSPITKVTLGSSVDNGLFLNGYLRRLAIFKSALSNAQLQALTT